MPVSGLVILYDEVDGDHGLKAELARNPCVTLGPPARNGRLPIVLETVDRKDDRDQIDWLRGLAGVRSVEVAFFDFRDVGESGEQIPRHKEGARGS